LYGIDIKEVFKGKGCCLIAVAVIDPSYPLAFPNPTHCTALSDYSQP